MDQQYPECNSDDIIRERQTEYTGGGFGDYWDEYCCKTCGYEWRGEKISDFA